MWIVRQEVKQGSVVQYFLFIIPVHHHHLHLLLLLLLLVLLLLLLLLLLLPHIEGEAEGQRWRWLPRVLLQCCTVVKLRAWNFETLHKSGGKNRRRREGARSGMSHFKL
jgi:hypothetical protein